MSFAVGRNPVPLFGQTRNIDLITQKNGDGDWPQARLNDPTKVTPSGEGRWLHGDVKDIAYRLAARGFPIHSLDVDLRYLSLVIRFVDRKREDRFSGHLTPRLCRSRRLRVSSALQQFPHPRLPRGRRQCARHSKLPLAIKVLLTLRDHSCPKQRIEKLNGEPRCGEDGSDEKPTSLRGGSPSWCSLAVSLASC